MVRQDPLGPPGRSRGVDGVGRRERVGGRRLVVRGTCELGAPSAPPVPTAPAADRRASPVRTEPPRSRKASRQPASARSAIASRQPASSSTCASRVGGCSGSSATKAAPERRTARTRATIAGDRSQQIPTTPPPEPPEPTRRRADPANHRAFPDQARRRPPAPPLELAVADRRALEKEGHGVGRAAGGGEDEPVERGRRPVGTLVGRVPGVAPLDDQLLALGGAEDRQVADPRAAPRARGRRRGPLRGRGRCRRGAPRSCGRSGRGRRRCGGRAAPPAWRGR